MSTYQRLLCMDVTPTQASPSILEPVVAPNTQCHNRPFLSSAVLVVLIIPAVEADATTNSQYSGAHEGPERVTLVHGITPCTTEIRILLSFM